MLALTGTAALVLTIRRQAKTNVTLLSGNSLKAGRMMKKLPIGKQSFDAVRAGDMVYVDKTAIIFRMIENNDQCFISRPRRFGKSLLVSTLESLFSRGTEMFKGLAIEKLWTDVKYKVMHLDFSYISCRTADEFDAKSRELFMGELRRLCFPPQIIESCSKCSDLAMMAARAFSAMELNSLVLLIDEYDSPLNLNLQNKTVFEGIRYKIRGFYAAIKANEGNFRFVFVTGVSRFNKVALFSAGSSIQDLSLNPLYGSLLGYTEDEIRHYFGEHLRAAAASIFKISRDEVTDSQIEQVMDELRRHYDGYCFDKKASAHVYQPWSVLQFLSPDGYHEFSDYWFQDSGVSSLLNNFVRFIGGVTAEDCNTRSIDWDSFVMNTDLNSPSNRAAVLTQCGYFTIKKVTDRRVRVGLPNLELRHAWAYLLSNRIRDESGIPDELTDSLEDACQALHKKDFSADELTVLFNSVYKVLNSSNRIVNEYAACDTPALYCLGSGYDVRTEVPEKGGRADLTFEFMDRRIIIEMKCVREGESAEKKLSEAESQILAHDYGSYIPVKPLRRFAMVFSIPLQKIVLAKEITAG